MDKKITVGDWLEEEGVTISSSKIDVTWIREIPRPPIDTLSYTSAVHLAGEHARALEFFTTLIARTSFATDTAKDTYKKQWSLAYDSHADLKTDGAKKAKADSDTEYMEAKVLYNRLNSHLIAFTKAREDHFTMHYLLKEYAKGLANTEFGVASFPTHDRSFDKSFSPVNAPKNQQDREKADENLDLDE